MENREFWEDWENWEWKIGNLPHMASGRISLPFSKLKTEQALRAQKKTRNFHVGGMNPTRSRHKNPFRISGNPTKTSEQDDLDHPCGIPDPFFGISPFSQSFSRIPEFPSLAGGHGNANSRGGIQEIIHEERGRARSRTSGSCSCLEQTLPQHSHRS